MAGREKVEQAEEEEEVEKEVGGGGGGTLYERFGLRCLGVRSREI